jgi:molybdenum cofactor cytidylyltransferase
VSVAGLILAAGESRRMGRPKALLPYRGATFLSAIVDTLQPYCSPVIIVLGAHSQEILDAAGDAGIFVTNKDYLLGQITSMQCGLRAAPPETEGVILSLVDHPAVTQSTIEALLSAVSESELVRIPRFDGRRGHPIWFSNQLIPEFLKLPPSTSAREVVDRHAGETRYVDVDDPGILADIDDPAAYARLIGAGE